MVKEVGPPPITLPFVEQVVLLSLRGRRIRARRAAKVAARVRRAGPRSYRAAARSLEARGLVDRKRVTRRLVAQKSPTLDYYERALRQTLATPKYSSPESAELFALVAAAGTLPLGNAKDHLTARLRIIDLRALRPLPDAVHALMARLRVSTTRELADKLLPPRARFGPASRANDRNMNQAAYGYMDSGSWSHGHAGGSGHGHVGGSGHHF